MKCRVLLNISIPTFIVCFTWLLLANNNVHSFTPEEEAVFEKAQKSLVSHENKSSIGSNFIQTANKTTGGLTLSNIYSFYDSGGYFHVTGEVINHVSDAMQNIIAVAGFYDSSKNVVGTNTGYIYPAVVNSGEKGAFTILGPDPTQVKKISSFKISLEGDYANPKPPSLKIKVGNHYKDEFGSTYTVAGELTNTGTEPSSFTEIYGIFYDKNGRVIEASFSYPPQSELGPGQSTPFEVVAYGSYVDKISSFKVFADSSEYSSVYP